jgi:hypothetical protein
MRPTNDDGSEPRLSPKRVGFVVVDGAPVLEVGDDHVRENAICPY